MLKTIDWVMARALFVVIIATFITMAAIKFLDYTKHKKNTAPFSVGVIKSSFLDKHYRGYKKNTNAKYSYLIRLHDKDGRFFCTGFVIDVNYAITAAHCVMESNSLEEDPIIIKDVNSRGTGITAFAAAAGSRLDYALIRGNFKRFNNIKIRTSKVVFDKKASYLGCGFPSGQKKVFCSDLEVLGNHNFAIAAKGYMYPGMSGGPVIELKTNTVVGVNSYVDKNIVAFYPLIGILESAGIVRR